MIQIVSLQGIDVFGRNTYGGGGLKCHVALDEIEKTGLSVALFAPGWIFEDEQFDKSNFESNSKKFWSQFERTGLKYVTYINLGTRIVFIKRLL